MREGLHLALAALAIAGVLAFADLTPRVESDFFFSSDDPQLANSEAITERFPSRPQVILRAAGDLASAEYRAKIAALTTTLAKVDGVASVQSLTKGPPRPEAASDSPLWRRLLIARGEGASNLIALVDEAKAGPAVREIERLAGASGLPVEISGVPFVVDQIRRHLLRDLRVFSLGAVLVFALVIGWLSRSLRIVAGTLATCLLACASTLGLLAAFRLHIGVLTANLVTIVFVLTLSHTVFLTSNWRRLADVREAVRLTRPASLGCMTATGLSFLSLLLASAKPLRELGIAGALGTVVAMATAYLFYPPFLERAPAAGGGGLRPFGAGLERKPALALVALALVSGLGIVRLSTDPGLLSFFKSGSPLREGLEAIDADGGSSPLSLVVADPAGTALDEPAGIAKLRALQAALEKDPAVGTALSVIPLLDEAPRVNPMAGFLPAKALIGVLEGPQYDHIARSFMSEDRHRAHVFLRMREGGREERRGSVIARVLGQVQAAGLRTELAGGLYELQGKLSELVASSLVEGLVGLLLVFFAIGTWHSRSARTGLAMVAALALVPLFLVGWMGFLGMPVDFIASPAAQVAIGIGVDSMIQLAVAAHRAKKEGLGLAAAWLRARAELGGAVVSASLIVALGFALFGLSSFPPTQRFGFAVALGTLMSGAVALWVLPVLAGRESAGKGSAARLAGS